jgi:hypothetical protein
MKHIFHIKHTFASALLSGALLIVCFGAPVLARAQKANPAQPSVREQLIAKIEALKYAKIKSELSLDDAGAAQFFAVYKPTEKDIQDIVRARNEELQKLTALMNAPKHSNSATIDADMQKVRDLNKQIEDRESKLDDDLKPMLSSEQRARLLVFEHNFNRRVEEQVVKNQIRKGPPPELRQLRKQLRQQHLQNKQMKQAAKKAASGHR